MMINPEAFGCRKKCLIIDDDGFSLEVAQNFFGSSNIQTYAASTGEQGLSIFTQHHGSIGCVLIDSEMPGMNGKETMHAIREMILDKKWAKLPIFCVSGNCSQEFEEDMIDNGFDGVYVKPINWPKLIPLVKEALK